VSELRDLYPAAIVDHDRAPRNLGRLADASHAAHADNPLCGDEIDLTLRIAGDQIADARFEGRGCALSRAAASILTGQLPGLTPAAARALAAEFTAFVASDPDAPPPAALGDLAVFAGVRRFRARRGCATLPFRAPVQALGPTPMT
jgi:nitrogen fixation protein NifU and related proteins